MKTYSRLTLAFLLLILVAPQVRADEPPKDGKEVVVWSDSSGKFKIEATFVELVDDKLVVLKRASDGKILKIPLEKLSEKDQRFIKDLVNKKRRIDNQTNKSVANSSRTWRSKDGQFSVTAQLVNVKGDQVTLKPANESKTITVSLLELSDADRGFVQEFRVRQRDSVTKDSGNYTDAPPVVVINRSHILINGEELLCNPQANDLVSLFGTPRYFPPLNLLAVDRMMKQRQHIRIYDKPLTSLGRRSWRQDYLIWDNLGISAELQGDNVEQVEFQLAKRKRHPQEEQFYPKMLFEGQLTLDGEVITKTTKVELVRKLFSSEKTKYWERFFRKNGAPPREVEYLINSSKDPFKKSWVAFKISYKSNLNYKGSKKITATPKQEQKNNHQMIGNRINFSLFWNGKNDLDIQVQTPSGKIISPVNRVSPDGGKMDIEANKGGQFAQNPIENIFWPDNDSPPGKYKITVVNSGQHEPTPVTPFRVMVNTSKKDGTKEVKDFKGRIQAVDEAILVGEITLKHPVAQ